jgi:hypothetical protein
LLQAPIRANLIAHVRLLGASIVLVDVLCGAAVKKRFCKLSAEEVPIVSDFCVGG